jgi:hypothetical protein
MTSYLPISAGHCPSGSLKAVSISPRLSEFINRVRTDQVDPETLNNFNTNYREMSIEAAVELGFTLGDLGASSMKRVVVYECYRYRDLVSEDESSVLRVGSSARCIILTTKNDTRAKITPFAMLAINTNLKYVENSVEIEGLGISPGPLFDAIPKFSSVDMTSYVILEHAFSKSLPELMKDSNQLKPVILGTFGELNSTTKSEKYRTAIATSYAITEIAKGVPMSNQIPGRSESDEFKSIVRQVYNELGIVGDDASPTALQRATARDLLQFKGTYETEKAD